MISPVPMSNDFSPRIKFEPQGGQQSDDGPIPNFNFSSSQSGVMAHQHQLPPQMFAHTGRILSPHHKLSSPNPPGMMSPQHNMLPHHMQLPPGHLPPMNGFGPGGLPRPPPHMLPPHMHMIPPHHLGPAGFPNMMMLQMMQQQQHQQGSRPPGMTPPPHPGQPPLRSPHSKQYPPNQALIVNPQNPNAPPIHPCGACRRELQENEEAVMCESGCNFFFHRQCINMSPEAYQFIKNEPFAEWVCDTCVKMRNIAPLKLKP